MMTDISCQQLGLMADKASLGLESVIQKNQQNKLLENGLKFCETIIDILSDKKSIIDCPAHLGFDSQHFYLLNV